MKYLRQIIRNTILESVGHSKMDELIQRFLDDPRGLMIAIDDRTPYNGYSIELIAMNDASLTDVILRDF